jgi:hypothetical protein
MSLLVDPQHYATTWDDPGPDDTPQASDLRMCPRFSIAGDGIEKGGHRQERKRECGTTRIGRSRLDPKLWVVYWVPCKTLGCDYCGPRVRAQKARGYLDKIGDQPLVKRVVTEQAWQAMTRRLRRGNVNYLQVPAPDGLRVVLLDAGDGTPVADTTAEVTALVAAFPAGTRRNISASKAWQPTAVQAPAATDQPDGYDFAGFIRAGLDHAREVAADLGLLVGDVAGRGGDAFLVRQPDDPLTWRRFCRWAGFEEPGQRRPGKRRRREAA